MVIGRHECKNARDTRLREAIAICLDEEMTALEEAFYDLTDEQASAFPIPGHNNIAWIVMHCLDNLDEYAVGAPTGDRVFAGERRWSLWECQPEERPKPDDTYPSVHEMLGRLSQVRAAALDAIEQAQESFLIEPFGGHPMKANRADFYMRTICHTTAHLRQIWLMRGALDLTGGGAWPQQHWA
jgi:DinB family protein